MLAATDTHPELQAIEAIQAADPFAIHQPALPPQQHPDPLIPKPRSGMSQIANAHSECGLILRLAAAIP